jgi:nucleotide-binding universal stress UspA family protein
MTDTSSATANLLLIVGYDESEPASRALDTAVRLLQGRTGGGRLQVVYVAHLPSAAMFSAGAIGEMETSFDELEQQLRASIATRLQGHEDRWGFERRNGFVPDELIAVANEMAAAHPHDIVTVVVGSSSHASHRLVGSVAVHLARHSPVPLIVVP